MDMAIKDGPPHEIDIKLHQGDHLSCPLCSGTRLLVEGVWVQGYADEMVVGFFVDPLMVDSIDYSDAHTTTPAVRCQDCSQSHRRDSPIYLHLREGRTRINQHLVARATWDVG
jgi:hypothetical protein